jgi:hypothetical protein
MAGPLTFYEFGNGRFLLVVCKTIAFAAATVSSMMHSMGTLDYYLAVSVVIAGSWVTLKGQSSTVLIMEEPNPTNSEFSNRRCLQPLNFFTVFSVDSSEESLALFALLGILTR